MISIVSTAHFLLFVMEADRERKKGGSVLSHLHQALPGHLQLLAVRLEQLSGVMVGSYQPLSHGAHSREFMVLHLWIFNLFNMWQDCSILMCSIYQFKVDCRGHRHALLSLENSLNYC